MTMQPPHRRAGETPPEGVPAWVEATGSVPVVDSGRTLPPRRLLRGTERLAWLVGQRLLVGVTFVDADGALLGRDQFCGQVLEVADGVVVVERPGQEEPALIPADEEAFRAAPPGQYTLANSGEVVVDPDVMTTWTVVVNDG